MSTLFLATVMGWYLVIIGLFFLLRHEQVKSIITALLAQRELFFILAIITLILGLLMVISHNVWVMGWPVIITIVAWLVFISSLIRLFYADLVIQKSQSYISSPTCMRMYAVVFLLIGFFLLYHVYILQA